MVKEIIQGSSRVLIAQIRRGDAYIDFTALGELSVVLVNNNSGAVVILSIADYERRADSLRIFIKPDWTAETGRYRLRLSFLFNSQIITLDPFVFTVVKMRPNDVTGFSQSGFGLEIEYVASIESSLPAAGGELASYVHTQSEISDTWYVQHKMGSPRPLLILVRDAAGELVACEADYPASTTNLLVLRFGVATAGMAVIAKL